MATNRKVQSKIEKISSDPSIISPHTETGAPPRASSSVAITLIAFSLAMLALPLGTYFVTVDRIFKGNATAAGALAALMANVVLVGYVYLAWKDDQIEQAERKALADIDKDE